MENLVFGAPEVPHEISYPAVGRTALELLAEPIEPVEASGPQPTPPIPFPTAPKPTAPDHTGYPDVSPPDQEYLQE
jgi:hypothetical protein